jgi:hypothetical protein
MTFTGWEAGRSPSSDRLQEENTKAFWERNKTTYDTLVRAPMDGSSGAQKEWGKGTVPAVPRRAVQRTSRPTRRTSRRRRSDGYVSLDAKGLGAGVGMWR